MRCHQERNRLQGFPLCGSAVTTVDHDDRGLACGLAAIGDALGSIIRQQDPEISMHQGIIGTPKPV